MLVLWAFAAPATATPTPQAACALFSPELLANASGSPTVAQIWWDARTMPLVGLLECAEQFPEQRARALAWMGPVLDAWLLPGGPAELGLEGHPWRPRWGACDIAGVPPLLYLLARRAANASIDAEVVSAFADYWLRNKNLLPSGAAARLNGGATMGAPARAARAAAVLHDLPGLHASLVGRRLVPLQHAARARRRDGAQRHRRRREGRRGRPLAARCVRLAAARPFRRPAG